MVRAGEVDEGGRGGELLDGLAAGSAGSAGYVVEGGDDDGGDAEVGAVLGDGGGDGVLFGAGGETVGGIFHVAAGDGFAVGEEDSCAYAEVTVGGVGVLRGFGGLLLERGELSWVEGFGRHDGLRLSGAGGAGK